MTIFFVFIITTIASTRRSHGSFAFSVSISYLPLQTSVWQPCFNIQKYETHSFHWKKIKLMLITNTSLIMSKHGSRSCFLWSNKIPQPGQSSHRVCAQQFHLVHSHVEAGMFSHLRLGTDTGQQGMEVFNTITITVHVSLTHANLVAIFSVVE